MSAYVIGTRPRAVRPNAVALGAVSLEILCCRTRAPPDRPLADISPAEVCSSPESATSLAILPYQELQPRAQSSWPIT